MSSTNHFAGFARNVVANWSAVLFVAGPSFFLSPFIVQSLGNVAYGIWALLGALVGYLGLLDFGVRGAVTRYVAHHHAAHNPQECTRIVSAGILLFGLLGFLAIVCAVAFAFLVTLFFNVPHALVNETRIVIVLSGLTIAIALMGGVFGGVVAGLQRFDIGSGIEILITAIRAGAIILALNAGYSLIALAIIQLLSSVLTGGATWLATRKLYPQLRLEFQFPLRPHMRMLLSFGAFSSLIHISAALSYYSDALVIAAFLPISLVTFYAIAASLCNYAWQVVSALSVIMVPRVSAMNAIGGEALEQLVLGAARIATLTTVPIVATFWWRGESFINLWMGPDYGATAGEVLHLLAVVVWLGGARSVVVSTIMGVNKHRFLVPVLMLEALCNLVLSIVLVGSLGLVGVALGTLIPSLIVTVGYLPQCLRKTIGVRVGVFYRDVWVLPTIACMPFSLATFLVERFFPAEGLAFFFMQVTMLLPLIPAAAMVLCLTPSEKKQIASLVKKVALSTFDVARKSALKFGFTQK